MKRMLLVAAAITLSAASAQSAAALAYPSTCPIANPNGYAPFKNCLIDTEARQIPTGSLANTTISLQRPEVGINVSPRVVRFGQKFTVSAVESFPPCEFNDIPSTPSGCVNSGRSGLTGFYLRLLPLLPPQLDVVGPSQYPMLRQSGPCSIPTRCTYEFVAPGPADASTAARLLRHWIVAGVNVYIQRGVEQGTNRVQWLQDPARTDRAEVEAAIRLCPPSVPCPSEVSGTVTQQGSSRTGVGGVSVRAACPSGSTTTTDANGRYSFVLNQGECAISVTPPSGETATPQERRVHVSPSHNLAGVDFQVGCNHDKTARALAGAACPLKVFVKVEGPITNVGTWSGLHVEAPRSGQSFGGEGPVKFTTAMLSKQGQSVKVVQKCLSGCANLLVTVIDPRTHRPPDPSATVTAELTGIDTPRPHMEGEQSLCTQSETPQATQCGTKLADLSTDARGQVHLIYWAPGTVGTLHTHLIVAATACTSSSSACRLGRCARGSLP